MGQFPPWRLHNKGMPIGCDRAPPPTLLRCAVYTRQSVHSESDLTSCEDPGDLCCRFLRSRHPEFVSLEEPFDEEGVSGATVDRPALQRLPQKIRPGDVDAVAVHRRDGLSRPRRL